MGSLQVTQEISFYSKLEAFRSVVKDFTPAFKGLYSFKNAKESNAELQLIFNPAIKNPEAYTLKISENGIQIEAGSEPGIYYGLQSLNQLFQSTEPVEGQINLPYITIEDEPRFSWRGLMLDESRHFFGKEKVKQLLDLMAFHKLNIFHWHLTDDPGWRVEIKYYPKLTQIGGKGNDINPDALAQYYTQEEITEIVEYAAERFIEVIPEIDMPGHARAANRSYPEYSGGGSKSHPDFTFNPGNEATYSYLTTILKEISVLFPSKFIHLGGDEVHFGNQAWNTDKHVQGLMKKENLKDLKEVESYFVHRMADSIKMLNRKVIGWDEIVDHKLDNKNSLVMWWRHDKPYKLEAALNGDYELVLCPRIPLYFDFVQDNAHEWGRKWRGAFSTLELTYAFPPDTLQGFANHINNVKGIQANIWTERIQNDMRLDFMTHPRLSALAESAWTKAENKNTVDFKRRLKPLLNNFEKQGIYYYNPFNPELTPEPIGVDKKKQK